MKLFTSKRRVIALLAFIVLLLFILRPGASRLKSRIVTSISSAVGRTVEVSSVQIRILPRPGFVLHDLVVYDDPTFGAEPMLRASEVSAALRVTSLLRGRLEVARLDLTDPSLNLVHAPQGGWNLEALVERSAHKALAPTGKAKSESRPGFPYIEGTSARINFKNGAEKKPYALTNADFALWQDSENTWGVRLKAQPFRGDFNLNDTGILLVNGTWQRASLIRDTPMQLSLEWSRAQLGQITKFFSGNDRGWRGAVQLDVELTGTPANLKVTSSVSVQDFRRYDIVSGDALKLAARCDAQYSSLDHVFRDLNCAGPVGDGSVRVKGELGLPGSRIFDLELTADKVPASAAAALMRRAKKNLPEDLMAGGLIQGRWLWHQDAASASKSQFEGRGEITEFRLASISNKAEIGPVSVPFVFRAGAAPGARKLRTAPGIVPPDGAHVEFGPFPVAVGKSVTARGWIAHSGYNVALAGEADVSKTLRLAQLVGIPALPATADGAASVDLRIAGTWSGWSYGSGPGFPGPQVNGTARLHNLRFIFRGTGAPVELSGDLQLLPDTARLEKLSAKVADEQWTGSLELPRGCGTPGACQAQFKLNTSTSSWRAFANWVHPQPAERPWYRVLESSASSQPSLLTNLRASGRVTADRFELPHLSATHFAANLRLDRGRIDLSQASADGLGGKLTGEWRADLDAKLGVCSGTGKLIGISLSRLAETAKDERFTGTANANYEIKGPCGSDFWTSAEGIVQVKASNAVVPGISLADDSAPLRILQLEGEAKLQAGQFAVEDVKVDSASGKFQLSGTAGLDGTLDLKLARPTNVVGSSFSISGTLSEPRVKATTGVEQARLKP